MYDCLYYGNACIDNYRRRKIDNEYGDLFRTKFAAGARPIYDPLISKDMNEERAKVVDWGPESLLNSLSILLPSLLLYYTDPKERNSREVLRVGECCATQRRYKTGVHRGAFGRENDPHKIIQERKYLEPLPVTTTFPDFFTPDLIEDVVIWVPSS